MQLESLFNTAQRWITSTQKLFSQPPKVLVYRPGQTASETPAQPVSDSRVFWVVGRRSTRQSIFTFPGEMPESKRNAALRVQVRRWAPFADVKYMAQWAGNRASVYAWNDGEISQTIREAGLNPRRCIVYPEAFVRAPLQDGARLVAAVEGFEAQVWQAGFLAQSRWWPQRPSAVEWDMFVRSAGGAVGQSHGQAPEPQSVAFLDSPWIRHEGYFGGTWSLLEDPRYAGALVTLVAAPFIYVAVEYATLAVANAGVKQSLEALSVETQGIRKLRSAAIANLDEIEDYLSLEVYPSQFEVMTTALGLLQRLQVKIPEWTYDVGTLAFTLRSEQSIDATSLITAFEKSGAFTNVTAARVGQEGQVRVRMEVLPKQAKTASRQAQR